MYLRWVERWSRKTTCLDEDSGDAMLAVSGHRGTYVLIGLCKVPLKLRHPSLLHVKR